MEYIRASRIARRAVIITDPRSVDSVADMWTPAGAPRPSAFSCCCSAQFSILAAPSFLAAPLSIIGLVAVHHLFPSQDIKLPD